jgi:flagellar motor switch protein FliN/FliY
MVEADENQEQLKPDADELQPNVEKTPPPNFKNYPENSGVQAGASAESTTNMDFILDIPIEVTVELGRSKMLVNELLQLGQGSVIELSKLAGETLEILANQKLIARGEVVVVDDKYGVRLTEVISPTERIERLR